jgi:hypothetical protein
MLVAAGRPCRCLCRPLSLSFHFLCPHCWPLGGAGSTTGVTISISNSNNGNTYSAYDLEALAVCEAVRHRKCYLEGFSKFLVVSYHGTMRHLLWQPNDMLVKQAATSSHAGLSAGCGHDDTCGPKGSLELSCFIKSETGLRTSCRSSTILGWRCVTRCVK